MQRFLLIAAALCLAVPALARDQISAPAVPSATLTIGPGGFVRGPITVTLSDGTVIFHVDAGSTVGTSAPVAMPPAKESR